MDDICRCLTSCSNALTFTTSLLPPLSYLSRSILTVRSHCLTHLYIYYNLSSPITTCISTNCSQCPSLSPPTLSSFDRFSTNSSIRISSSPLRCHLSLSSRWHIITLIYLRGMLSRIYESREWMSLEPIPKMGNYPRIYNILQILSPLWL